MDIRKIETAISDIDEKYILEAAEYIEDAEYMETDANTESREYIEGSIETDKNTESRECIEGSIKTDKNTESREYIEVSIETDANTESREYIEGSIETDKNTEREYIEGSIKAGEHVKADEKLEVGKDIKARECSRSEKRKQHKKVRRFRRIAACFIAATILSMSTLTLATAAGNIPAYDILYSLYPEIAKKLTPVNLSCVDNGIKMEVEAVDVENDIAKIYISMKDLEGNRIDGTIDLFDSYSIHSSSDSIGNCSLVDYNEEEKEATFLIQLQQMHGKKITGKKLTFSVSEFLSGKHKMDEEIPEILLENMDTVSDTQQDVDRRGGSGMGDLESVSEFLKINEKQRFSPIDGVTVTAYGFVDGRLHVQVYYENILETDNHGYIYFKDKDGNIIHSDVTISFWDEEHRGSYDEYIFNISSVDELKDDTVWGYFNTCPNLTKGNWEVTFLVE